MCGLGENPRTRTSKRQVSWWDGGGRRFERERAFSSQRSETNHPEERERVFSSCAKPTNPQRGRDRAVSPRPSSKDEKVRVTSSRLTTADPLCEGERVLSSRQGKTSEVARARVVPRPLTKPKKKERVLTSRSGRKERVLFPQSKTSGKAGRARVASPQLTKFAPQDRGERVLSSRVKTASEGGKVRVASSQPTKLSAENGRERVLSPDNSGDGQARVATSQPAKTQTRTVDGRGRVFSSRRKAMEPPKFPDPDLRRLLAGRMGDGGPTLEDMGIDPTLYVGGGFTPRGSVSKDDPGLLGTTPGGLR
jgi:hypothetical protein